MKTLAGPEMMDGVVLAVRRLAKEAPECEAPDAEEEMFEEEGEAVEAGVEALDVDGGEAAERDVADDESDAEALLGPDSEAGMDADAG